MTTSMQLRHAVKVTSGATPESGTAEYWDGDIPWVTPEDVGRLRSGYWLHDTRRKLSNDGYANCGATVVPKQSLVLTKRAPIGQLAVLAIPACCNQGCFLLTAREAFDARFLYYLLSTRESHLQALGRGSTFLELATDDLKALKFEFPRYARQRSIAAYLDLETAKIDEMIAAKQRLLEILAEKRRALITHSVTRGLDSIAPTEDSCADWLGKAPAHWLVRRLAYQFRERDQRNEPDLPLLEVSLNHGVVRREFSSDKIEGTAADFNTYKVARQGDIVFNKMRMWQGAVGAAPMDGLVSPDYVVAEPIGQLSSAFAALLFRIPAFSAECGRRSYGLVWDRLRLYWDGFRDIYVAIPPRAEQDAIVQSVTDRCARMDAFQTEMRRSIELLRERRSALIAAAVTGQIDVEAAA